MMIALNLFFTSHESQQQQKESLSLVFQLYDVRFLLVCMCVCVCVLYTACSLYYKMSHIM